MKKEEFIKELKNINIEATEEELLLLDKYYSFLVQYNKMTNITGIIEEEAVYLKHFFDSLTLSKIVDFSNINNVLDIGSGGGFPGVVIKIFFPNINLCVIDSNNKKTKFLNELKEYLNLEYTVINDRAENYSKKTKVSFDLVTARAVASFDKLISIASCFLNKDNMFVAMKGCNQEEIEKGKNILKNNNLIIERLITFQLPIEKSKRTLIKVIKKIEKK